MISKKISIEDVEIDNENIDNIIAQISKERNRELSIDYILYLVL